MRPCALSLRVPCEFAVWHAKREQFAGNLSWAGGIYGLPLLAQGGPAGLPICSAISKPAPIVGFRGPCSVRERACVAPYTQIHHLLTAGRQNRARRTYFLPPPPKTTRSTAHPAHRTPGALEHNYTTSLLDIFLYCGTDTEHLNKMETIQEWRSEIVQK